MAVDLRATQIRAAPRLWVVALVCIAAGIAIGALCVLVNPLYVLAAVPLLAVSAWVVRRGERGLWLIIAIIALLPRIASPVSLGFKPTLLDGALVLALLGWLLWRGKATPSVHSALTWPLVGLMTIALTTFILGIPNGALTTLVLRRFAELVGSLGMVFVLISILRQPDALRRAAQIVIVSGAASAVTGLILYVMPADLATRVLSALAPFGYPSGTGVLRYILDDPGLMQRATGLWIDPNAYGGYLMLVGALTLPQLFAAKPILPRLWIWACMGLVALALVLTVSRSAMLGLALAGLVAGTLRYRRLLLLLAIAAVAALILPQTRDLVAHFIEGFAGTDLSTQMRFGEYKDAFRLIERYPLLGVGFVDTPDVDLYIGVSSMYLLIAQQMGMLGVAAFLASLAAIFVPAARAWSQGERGDLWIGAHAAILAACFSGIFDHYFFNIDFHNSVVWFWLFMAMAVASRAAQPPSNLTTSPRMASVGVSKG